jgi:hypothetical protein
MMGGMKLVAQVAGVLRDAITRGRNAALTAGAYDRGRAIQLDHECGERETLMSAQLKFRAAWFDLFAATLGHRPRT